MIGEETARQYVAEKAGEHRAKQTVKVKNSLKKDLEYLKAIQAKIAALKLNEH